MKQDNPLVSIIIPTKNSARTIQVCLQSCKDQTYPHIEIIVVDNYSTDWTKVIAKIYTDKVYQQWPERTTQKNLWIAKAQWEHVFFVDSDMVLTSEVVEECMWVYQSNNGVWGVCIPEHSIGKGLFVKIRDFERSFYAWTWVESARFFRLDDVKCVGGFEEDLIFFEESLLPQKIESQLDKSCKYVIQSHINHDEDEIRLLPRLQKKFYYGKSLKEYKKKVQELWIIQTWEDQMSIISRYMIFLRNKRFYSKPLLALGILFLKTMEFWAWGLGLLANKI